MLTVHVLPITESQPDQDINVSPEAGVAVNVMELPELKNALQVAPQLMPAGLEVTLPAPTRLTFSA